MHVSVTEVIDLLRGFSNDKATSMEGLSGESLKFADSIFSLLLSICRDANCELHTQDVDCFYENECISSKPTQSKFKAIPG